MHQFYPQEGGAFPGRCARSRVFPSEPDMRRILVVFAAALALTALPKTLSAGTGRAIPRVSHVLSGSPSAMISVLAQREPLDAEAGEDGDDSPFSIASSSPTGRPDPP